MKWSQLIFHIFEQVSVGVQVYFKISIFFHLPEITMEHPLTNRHIRLEFMSEKPFPLPLLLSD